MNIFINIRDFLYYNRKIILVIFFFLLFAVSYLFFKSDDYDELVYLDDNNIYDSEVVDTVIKKYIVDVKGAVKFPGTYELEEGKRVIDVINLAGGVLENADLLSINLSKKISDEMLIIIPEINIISEENFINDFNNDGKISINYGTLENLMSLNGIGEIKAKAIIDYRNNNGMFKTIEDIKNVSGIGNSTFEKIKDYIKL